MIRYKVVKKVSIEPFVGYSCYATGEYQLTYKENTIVTAEEGTLGIAVFERRYQAYNFMQREFSFNSCKIIRVIPIGRGKRYCFVCDAQDTSNLDYFYRRLKGDLSVLLGDFRSIRAIKSPPGSIFYQQVKVLE